MLFFTRLVALVFLFFGTNNVFASLSIMLTVSLISGVRAFRNWLTDGTCVQKFLFFLCPLKPFFISTVVLYDKADNVLFLLSIVGWFNPFYLPFPILSVCCIWAHFLSVACVVIASPQ